ncbi:cyclic nucleotide-binding domain-containing protein [Oscillatoria sp. FACHB-1407]|uniref:cyclic nucleotide-binding domain-containing protein n=1 Tax=Oscillatoria sp. FACHB-1407 TaxID=2692847 RepID=UPI0016882F72|nr:cyclic nucleotide-binding domain-containing protein [Oscillatoria sp. FACHB-1407]MBD2463935.1 cyclic nucleotide-binding domain-containing protein [Oscillatoria sp. FACHB-1407]
MVISAMKGHKQISFPVIRNQRLAPILENLILGTIGVFSILILTGGNPSGFTITLVFFLGTAFFAIKKTRRLLRQQQIFQLNHTTGLDTSKQTVISVLRGWKQLDSNARAWLISTGKSKSLLEGDNLIIEGETIDALYIVLEGELEVRISALPDRKVALLQPGDVVGEMSFVQGYPPSASVIATEDSCVWAIPCSRLNRKLKRDKAFAARFYEALAGILAKRLHITTLVQNSISTGSEQSEKFLEDLSSVGIMSFSPTLDDQ